MSDTRSARIRDELRRDILSGRLVPGARLPTERELAVQYGLTPTTINKIMTALELDGLLDRRRGTGTYVRPDLARRALAVVLGPPGLPPASLWQALAQQAIESASKREGGVRTYVAAGTALMAETPLAADARTGRLDGALLLGAGPVAATILEEAGLPLVHVAGSGPGPMVRIAWREATRDLAADMLRRGAWPLAVQLPGGAAGDEIAAGYRGAVAAAGRAADENWIGRAAEADGPAGWRWAGALASRGVRGFVLAGDRPESAAAAVLHLSPPAAVAIWTCVGGAPALGRDLARLELDPAEIVQAGFEMLAAMLKEMLAGTVEEMPAGTVKEMPAGTVKERGAAPASESPEKTPVPPTRVIRPRFIEGETLRP